MLYLIKRDLSLAFCNISDIFTTLLFSIIVLLFFPLAFGSNWLQSHNNFYSLLLIIILLSSMLNQHIIFGDDEEDGSLEQIILSGLSPYQIIIAKIIVYFLLSFAPLVIFLPLLGLALYNLTFQNVIMLVAVILCCSLSFAVVNIFAAALNLGIRARQIVASIIIAPLSVSTLIFGAYSLIEQSYSGLTLLASLLMVLTPILIFASSLLLR